MTGRSSKPLWKCPECGHRFVTENLSHSCVNVPLAAHFRDRPPELKRAFDQYVRMAREIGPATVYAQKTRIILMVKMRFAGAIVRKSFLQPHLVLTRPAEHPLLSKVDFVPPRYYVHSFKVTAAAQFDTAFAKLLREAYRVGCREHLR